LTSRFRWAQLQISLFGNPDRKIQNPKDVDTELKKLEGAATVAGERDLNNAYANIFERNTPRGEIEKAHAKKAYQLMLASREFNKRLSITALTQAVAFDENSHDVDEQVNEDYVLNLCRDFVVLINGYTLKYGEKHNWYAEHLNIPEFAHVSVKDYLQGTGEGSLISDDYSRVPCLAQMTKTCIGCLRVFDSSLAPIYAFSGSLPGFDHFQVYATRYWGEYCAKLSESERASWGGCF